MTARLLCQRETHSISVKTSSGLCSQSAPSFFLLVFWPCPWHEEVPGQGRNPHHSSHQSHSSYNARSLTPATRTTLPHPRKFPFSPIPSALLDPNVGHGKSYDAGNNAINFIWNSFTWQIPDALNLDVSITGLIHLPPNQTSYFGFCLFVFLIFPRFIEI